jgi:hypothetical protein
VRIDLLLIQGLGISLESFLHYLIQWPPWTKSNSKEVYVLLTWERKKIYQRLSSFSLGRGFLFLSLPWAKFQFFTIFFDFKLVGSKENCKESSPKVTRPLLPSYAHESLRL